MSHNSFTLVYFQNCLTFPSSAIYIFVRIFLILRTRCWLSVFLFPFCIFTTGEWSKLITPLQSAPGFFQSRFNHKAISRVLEEMGGLGSFASKHFRFPTPFHLSLYLAHLASTGPKSAADPIDAVKWIHGLAGFSSPTDNPLVKNALQGFKRIHSSPTAHK